jgi:HTH-type transcriptional regulator, competence development regulator
MLSRNEFGIFALDFRADRDLLLRDFAEKLGVTASFLSNVEHGRKPVPSNWEDELSEIYELNVPQKAKLRIAIMRANRSRTVLVETDAQARLLVAYEDNRDSVDLEAAEEVETLLSDRKEANSGQFAKKK